MMHRRHPWICVFSLMLLVVAATVTAQKAKPAPPPSTTYVWSAVLGPEDPAYGIFGSGTYVSGSAAANGDTRVSVIYYAPTKASPGRTEFVIRLTGVDSSQSHAPWIGFRGLTEASTSGVPLCNFPGVSYGATDCILRFLSGPEAGSELHPQIPYSSVMVKLAVPGLRFDTMTDGREERFSSGSIGVTVDGASDDLGLLSSVYSLADFQAGTIIVTRTGANTWQTDAALPMVAYELARYQRPNGSTGTTVPATTTTYLKTYISWTRILVGGN